MSDEPRWIRNPAELAELAGELGDSSWLAVDTESNSRFVYQEQICLVQLSWEHGIALIDPFELPGTADDLAPLKALIEDPAQALLVHGGEYDVACLQRDYGIKPAGLEDSQQAASLLGHERTGYGALVKTFCDVELAKEHSLYNWGERPIDADALAYAVDDVRYLPTVMAGLREQIADADLHEEWSIANEAVMEVDAHNANYDPQGIYRIKGVGKLHDKQLGLLFALFQWRDAEARKANLPPGRIINNDSLLQLARNQPTNFGSLKRLRLHRKTLAQYGDKLIDCIKAHRHDPPAPPEPPARREPDPREREREQSLKTWRRKEADKRGVTLQVVLPARALEHLKKFGAADLGSVPQFGDKRAKRYGSALQKLLS